MRKANLVVVVTIVVLILSCGALAQGINLTPDMILQLARAFDANHDGCLSLAEAQTALPSVTLALLSVADTNGDGLVCLGDVVNSPLLAPSDVYSYIVQVGDADGDGQVTLEEVWRVLPGVSQEEFNRADHNADGVLSMADVAPVVNPPIPPIPPILPGGDLWALFSLIDADGSGGVSLVEAAVYLPGLTPGLFQMLDADSSGEVTQQELLGLSTDDLVAIGLELLRVTDTNVDGAISLAEAQAFCPLITADLFQLADQNRDGVLSLADLITGGQPPVPPADPIQQLLAIYQRTDPNHDGCLSFEETQTLIPALTPELFQLFDKNGDALVCLSDVQVLGSDDIQPIADKILELADTDGDGALSLAEAQAFIPAVTPEIFWFADQNGDGLLSVADLAGELPLPPPPPPPPSSVIPPDIQQLIQLVGGILDQNGDGAITCEEAAQAPIHAFIALLAGNYYTGILPAFPPGFEDDFRALMGLLCVVLDLDGDGRVVVEDLLTLTPDQLKAIVEAAIQQLDTDGDSAISLAEAKAFVPVLVQMGLFQYLDQNGDGLLSVADLAGELPPTPPPPPPVPPLPPVIPPDIQQLIQLVGGILDRNGDGAITCEEAQAQIPALIAFLKGNIVALGVLPMFPAGFEDDLRALMGLLCVVLDLDGDGRVVIEDLLTLTPDQLKAIVEAAIQQLDTDGDSSISLDEAKAFVPVLVQMGVFQYLDQNGDGQLDLKDLNGAVTPQSGFNGIDELSKLFLQLDPDGDGCVTYDDATKVIPGLSQELFDFLDKLNQGPVMRPALTGDGLVCPNDLLGMTPDQIAKAASLLIASGDADGDGALSLEEAQALVPALTPDLFRFVDVNGDGKIALDDLGSILPPPPPPGPVQQFVDLFNAMDANKDGCLTLDEARTGIPALPEDLFLLLDQLDEPPSALLGGFGMPPIPSDGRVCLQGLLNASLGALPGVFNKVLEVADTDGDKAISLEEAQAFIPGFTADMFKFVDQNGDGKISAEDLPGYVGPGWPVLPMDELLRLLHEADANGDGVVTFDEALIIVPDLPQELFDKFDSNHDGVLSVDDLPSLPPVDPANRLLALLHEVDANGDGLLTLPEIQAVYPDFSAQAFAALDMNGDGVLSVADLPQGPLPGPREMLLQLLREADTDHDGQVTLQEFLAARPELTADDFTRLDLNGDGILTRADAPDGQLDPVQALLGLLRETDANGDGVVTFEEAAAFRPDLTQEQFASLDVNGDGVLSRDDLPPPTDPMARLIALLPAADANHDNAVTFDELQALAPDLTQEQFNKLDRNGDGVIASDDLAPPPPQDPRERLLALIRQVDANHDGAATLDEVRAVLPQFPEEEFTRLDANGDGVLTADDAATLPPIPEDNGLRQALLRSLVNADTNHNGELDYAEIAAAYPDAPAELLAAIDTDHNWSISRSEILNALGRGVGGETLVEAEDADGDGAITAADIQITINQVLGRAGTWLTVDTNGDGAIDAIDIQKVILKVLNGK
jgi:Ca2+-binding EF-hand superfamily protein